MPFKSLIASLAWVAVASPAWACNPNSHDPHCTPEISSDGALAAIVAVAAIVAIFFERRRRRA